MTISSNTNGRIFCDSDYLQQHRRQNSYWFNDTWQECPILLSSNKACSLNKVEMTADFYPQETSSKHGAYIWPVTKGAPAYLHLFSLTRNWQMHLVTALVTVTKIWKAASGKWDNVGCLIQLPQLTSNYSSQLVHHDRINYLVSTLASHVTFHNQKNEIENTLAVHNGLCPNFT